MRVVFDIGHGSDTWPPSKGVYLPDGTSFAEHTFNSKVAMAAKELAEKQGFEVLLSQSPNAPEIPLSVRSSLINEEHKKSPIICLMSFHANASNNKNASGWGVFYWHTSSKGKKLAELWAKYARDILPTEPWGSGLWQSKPDHWSNFHILRETLMPAVLIEHFFFTNPTELSMCNTEEYVNLSACVAVKALCEYAQIEFKEDMNVGTPILGKPQATIEQAKEWARKRGASQYFIDAAPIYWKYGELTGIRPEVLYAQSAKETAFGNFGGAVTQDMNNFAGIKIAKPTGDKKSDHQVFASPEDGVRGHFNHMGIYCGIPPIGEPHPRWFVTRTVGWAGTIKTVEELGGKWAPNPDYGRSIVRDYLNELLATKTDEVKELKAEITRLKGRIADYENLIQRIKDIFKEV